MSRQPALVQRLHSNIELIGAICIWGGLASMQVNDPNPYTQVGIVFWACAQLILFAWWGQRLHSAPAAIAMGVLNLGGGGAFCAGCIVFDSHLGMFISSAYILSASLQCASGAFRLPSFKPVFGGRLAARVLARKTLMVVAGLQAIAAMCFITLAPVAGMFFTAAAFIGIMGNVLLLQYELLLLDKTQTKSEPQEAAIWRANKGELCASEGL